MSGRRACGPRRDWCRPAAVTARHRHRGRQDRPSSGEAAAPVGWTDASGDGEGGVALRCAELPGACARLSAGVGIVSASMPEAELEATRHKRFAMRDAPCTSRSASANRPWGCAGTRTRPSGRVRRSQSTQDLAPTRVSRLALRVSRPNLAPTRVSPTYRAETTAGRATPCDQRPPRPAPAAPSALPRPPRQASASSADAAAAPIRRCSARFASRSVRTCTSCTPPSATAASTAPGSSAAASTRR